MVAVPESIRVGGTAEKHAQRRTIRDAICRLQSPDVLVWVAIVGTRKNGVMRPADKAEIVKHLSRVRARIEAGERCGVAIPLFRVVSTLGRRAIFENDVSVTLLASELRTLRMLAEVEDMTSVPPPPEWRSGVITKGEYRAKIDLDRSNRFKLSMSGRRPLPMRKDEKSSK